MVSDRGGERDHGGRIVAGWVLVEALVRPMVVEVMHVLVEGGVGVSFVVDQQPVGALVANAASEPLGIAVRSRRPARDLDHIEAFGGEDGIEGGGEFSVSVAIRKRNEVIRSPRSISRLRAVWVVQAAVGWAVTPSWAVTSSRCARRVRSSMTNKT
jgi:hypothetical protein